MIALTILTVGTVKEPYLRQGIDEYVKRLSAYATVDIREIREEKIANEQNVAEVRTALIAEGQKLLAAAPKGAYRVALCVEGKLLASEELAACIDRAVSETGKICFFIGSSHGLSDEVKRAADLRLSVSPLTFPHQLMRLILTETLYRSMTILAGKTYHK